MKLRLASVPGNLTCAAHAFSLSLLATTKENHKWFSTIHKLLETFVRETHDVKGTVIKKEFRTHILRDLVADTVNEKGTQFFENMFGLHTWYWDDLVAADIIGINNATVNDPTERGFIEHANPFFMVCAYLFNCQVCVVCKNGNTQLFSFDNTSPIIYVSSNATDGSLGSHFDALIPEHLDPIWSINLSVFFEYSEPYFVDSELVRDVVMKIEKWYSHLYDRFQEVCIDLDQTKSLELAELMTIQYFQEESDREFAFELDSK